MADKTPKALHYGVFTRKNPTTGETYELTAHTPADAVKYRFDGWTESEAATAPEPGTQVVADTGTGDVEGDSTGKRAANK